MRVSATQQFPSKSFLLASFSSESCLAEPHASQIRRAKPFRLQGSRLARIFFCKYFALNHRLQRSLAATPVFDCEKPRISFLKSLLTYLGEAHRGVRGFVFDENRNPIHKARLKIRNREIGFETTKFGEFWRILLPGVYVLEVFEMIERSFIAFSPCTKLVICFKLPIFTSSNGRLTFSFLFHIFCI